VESPSEVDVTRLKDISAYKDISEKLKIKSLVPHMATSVVHKLSHKHLYTRFWIAEVSELKENGISFSETQSFPVPILIGNFISEFSLFKD